jgi:hypothetical protein
VKKNLLIIVLAATALYQYRRVRELRESKVDELVREITMESQYASMETHKIFGDLPEPDETRNKDILERIDMLMQHTPHNPSENWVREVMQNAAKEIRELRGETTQIKYDHAHKDRCTYAGK